jgi:serine/threonine protein kinase
MSVDPTHAQRSQDDAAALADRSWSVACSRCGFGGEVFPSGALSSQRHCPACGAWLGSHDVAGSGESGASKIQTPPAKSFVSTPVLAELLELAIENGGDNAWGGGFPLEPDDDGTEADTPAGESPLDRYKHVRFLGRGGMASVYLVEDGDGKRFALKILEPDHEEFAEFSQRFMRESRIALRLTHPHVLRTHEAGSTPDGKHFMIAEYCPGGSLGDWLDVKGRVEPARALSWLREAAEGLDHAWREARVVHRDIKPENLLLDDHDRVRVADFGLALRLAPNATRLSMEGLVVGSAYYMSPEQAQASADLDARSDIYALGATFYHLMAGRPPLDGWTVSDILLQHIHEDPPPLRDHCPEAPENFTALVHRMLRKDPDDRPSDSGVLLEELRELGEETMSVTVPKPDLFRPKELRRIGESTEAWHGARAWLEVRDTGGEDDSEDRRWQIAIYARTPVRFGRSPHHGVDLPAWLYPTAAHSDRCMKASMLHGQFTLEESGWALTDLGSRNGTGIDGRQLPPLIPSLLPPIAAINIAKVLELEARPLAPSLATDVRLDGVPLRGSPSPAMVLRRVQNRTDLVYVLLHDRLPIGGDERFALTLPGSSSNAPTGALWWRGGFWWEAVADCAVDGRELSAGDLVPLAMGTTWRCGALEFRISGFTKDSLR